MSGGEHTSLVLLGLEEVPGADAPAAPDVVERLRDALSDDSPGDARRLEPAIPVRDVLPALVAVTPEALERHRRLGVPEDVSRDTLADVGRKVRAYGATTDIPWLVGLLRADVVALGRLQLERVAEPTGRAVHIPEQGPLDPAQVDDALGRARAMFGPGPMTCTSWLLDPTLRTGLPPSSNIVRFAERFAVDPDADPEEHPGAGDAAVAKFVFRRPLAEVLDPEAVVPRTRLERLVADHLRAGGHWTEPRGVLLDER